MKSFVLTEDLQEHVVNTVQPKQAAALDLAALRVELDGYYNAMRGFGQMDLEEVFLQLAGFSARAAEIRSTIVRSDHRLAQLFRTREIDPFLEQLEFQFKVFSRCGSMRELEFKMSGGAP